MRSKFIDRYLMILQNSDIYAVICLNKSDIGTSTYKKAGIKKLESFLVGNQVIFNNIKS